MKLTEDDYTMVFLVAAFMAVVLAIGMAIGSVTGARHEKSLWHQELSRRGLMEHKIEVNTWEWVERSETNE